MLSICFRRMGQAAVLLLAFLPAWFVDEAQDPKLGLRDGAAQFVGLVESQNVRALMDKFSEQGTSFIGSAYVPTRATLSQEEIRSGFGAKTGVYCLFFDTACFQREDSEERHRHNGRALREPLRSVLDLLKASEVKRFVTYDNLTNGKVTVLLSDRTPDTARLGQDAINLYLRFEHGQWKLATSNITSPH